MNDQRSTVLACVDGSEFTEAVVDYATWISRTVGNPLTLLHNIDQRPTPKPDLSGNLIMGTREHLLEELTEIEEKRSRLLKEQGRFLLDHARERATSSAAFEPTILQRHGSLAESLIEMEEEIRVLVLGVRGEDHGQDARRIGGQLETVIRSMHRPVLVVNRAFRQEPRAILLAYDEREAAQKALEMVCTSPLYKGMTCHLVHVAKDAESKREMLREPARQLQAAGLQVAVAILEGEASAVLLAYQQEHGIDMTVMGAFGQARLRELLFGSVTVKMLCRSQVPLLLLR